MQGTAAGAPAHGRAPPPAACRQTSAPLCRGTDGREEQPEMPGPGMELIDDDEVQEVLDVLRGGYLFRYGISLGPDVDPRFKGKVYQVEEEVARRSQVGYAVAVNSGTSALLVAL